MLSIRPVVRPNPTVAGRRVKETMEETSEKDWCGAGEVGQLAGSVWWVQRGVEDAPWLKFR